jgi:hypothetical protein
MFYIFDPKQDEFVEVVDFAELPGGGNTVEVTDEDDEGTKRFKVEIDDLGHVIGALNRLVVKFYPNFKFPANL